MVSGFLERLGTVMILLRTAMRLRHGLLLLLVFASTCTISLHSAASDAEVQKPQAAASDCDCPCAARTQDAIWQVSTRHLGCPSHYDPNNPDFQVMRYDSQAGWEDSELEAFLDTDDAQTTTAVFVHGYRIDWCTAFERGMMAYRSLVSCFDDPRPIRFVIWSWPSAPSGRPLRDVRAKAARCDLDSHYLAWFLSRLAPDTRVGLLGYSYGGRIVSGALHLMGGGEILGFGLDDAKPKANPAPRAVLLAAALHNYWLLPDRYHGKCVSHVDRMLVQYNPCDRVLRMYRLLDRCAAAEALGRTGFPWLADLDENASRIEQQNVSCEVGDEHSLRAYLASPSVMNGLRQYVLWQ